MSTAWRARTARSFPINHPLEYMGASLVDVESVSCLIVFPGKCFRGGIDHAVARLLSDPGTCTYLLQYYVAHTANRAPISVRQSNPRNICCTTRRSSDGLDEIHAVSRLGSSLQLPSHLRRSSSQPAEVVLSGNVLTHRIQDSVAFYFVRDVVVQKALENCLCISSEVI